MLVDMNILRVYSVSNPVGNQVRTQSRNFGCYETEAGNFGDLASLERSPSAIVFLGAGEGLRPDFMGPLTRHPSDLEVAIPS
jgi:hypothetical protein